MIKYDINFYNNIKYSTITVSNINCFVYSNYIIVRGMKSMRRVLGQGETKTSLVFPVASQNENLKNAGIEENINLTSQALRSYAAVFGGKLDPQASNIPKFTEADDSGFHMVTVVSSCDKLCCLKEDCVVSSTSCAVSSTFKNDTILQNSGGPMNLRHYAVGSLTHNIPKGKHGVIISTQDYSGASRGQELVIEHSLPEVDSTNFTINKTATKFLQKSHNTEAVLAAKTLQGSAIRDELQKFKK